MFGLIISLIISLWFLFTVFFVIFTLNDNDNSLIGLKEFIETLFFERNLFGKIQSTFILIICIPSMIVTLIFQVLLWIIKLFIYIWRLGYKK